MGEPEGIEQERDEDGIILKWLSDIHDVKMNSGCCAKAAARVGGHNINCECSAVGLTKGRDTTQHSYVALTWLSWLDAEPVLASSEICDGADGACAVLFRDCSFLFGQSSFRHCSVTP